MSEQPAQPTQNATHNIDNKHESYLNMVSSWELIEDTLVSEKHIHDKGEVYLPKLDGMDEDQYTAYITRASFPMFTKHVLNTFVGMVMRKDILISGIDKEHSFFKNIDGKGSTVKEYCSNLAKEFIKTNRCLTLVDYPDTKGEVSIAYAEEKGLTPRFSFYKATSIINWKYEIINNVLVPVLIVLEEEVDVSTNEFVSEPKPQWRVLRLEKDKSNGYIYTQQVYDHNKVGQEKIVPKMNNKPLSSIPALFHGDEFNLEAPVILPIAEQNIHWYILDADYKHGLHYVAIPTPYTKGVDSDAKDKPTRIGPSEIWYLPEEGDCGMLEFNGKGLGEVRTAKGEVFEVITTISSQILVPQSSDDGTATAASIRNATETASLSAIVNGLSEDITKAVVLASKWGKFYEEDTKITINSDFIPLVLSGADVSAYTSSVIKSGFSKYTLFNVLKRGEIIPGERQFEDEMKDIKKEEAEADAREVDKAKKLAEVQAQSTAEENAMNTQESDTKDSKTQSKQEGADKKSGSGVNKEN